MRALSFAFRGIWWRRWASLAVWAVAVACVAVAAIGPAYAAGARDAVLQTNLRQAPVDPRGTGISVVVQTNGKTSRDDLGVRVAIAFQDANRGGYLRPPIGYERGEKGVFGGGPMIGFTVPMVFRDGACAHVTLRAGRCVSESDSTGVVVTAETAASRRWKVGSHVIVGVGARAALVHVRGIYEPVEPDGTYWFGASNQYFGQVARYSRAQVKRGDAVLVPARFWDKTLPPAQGDDVTIGVDVALDIDTVHASNVARVDAAVTAASDRLYHPEADDTEPPSVATRLPTLLETATASTKAVATPILIVAAQLLVLTWLVLYLVLVSSADGRAAEIVLGKLRGLTPRETVLHTLLEPVLLIVAAVPVGVVVCELAMHAFAGRLLGAHVEVLLPLWSVLAALAAAVGGLLATIVAGGAVLRRSVVDQWRRTERRPRRRGWIVEVLVTALAVVSFVELATSPTMRHRTTFLPSLLPGLVALAAAVLAARAIPWLARAGFRPTRASRRVALFIALRQIGRRPADLRVFVLLTVAVALFAFGFAGRDVFRHNQQQRAITELGAERVVSISSPAGVDPSEVVDRLDPHARWASAVYNGSLGVETPTDPFGRSVKTRPTILVVDPARFARVAFWRADFGPHARLRDELTPLRASPPALVRITATTLRVDFSATVVSDLPVTLRLGLTDARGDLVNVALARLAPSRQAHRSVVSVAVPRCSRGCLVRRVSIISDVAAAVPPRIAVTFNSVVASGTIAARDVLPALRAGRWTAQDFDDSGRPADTIASDGDRLTMTFLPTGLPDVAARGYSVLSDLPAPIPALVTNSLISESRPRVLSVNPDRNSTLFVRPTGVTVLPRAGNAGVMIARAWLPSVLPDGYRGFLPNQIWLSAAAPADAPKRIAAAGLTVRSVQTVADRSAALAAQGPSYAVTMLLVGSAAAGGLALIGSTAALLIASRRRLYEMAAVRAMGVRPARVLGALVLEQAVVNVTAAAVGLLAGLWGARNALARVPQFVDDPEYPRTLLGLPILINVVLVLAAIAVITGVGALGGAVLVRQADPGRLREAQQ